MVVRKDSPAVVSCARGVYGAAAAGGRRNAAELKISGRKDDGRMSETPRLSEPLPPVFRPAIVGRTSAIVGRTSNVWKWRAVWGCERGGGGRDGRGTNPSVYFRPTALAATDREGITLGYPLFRTTHPPTHNITSSSSSSSSRPCHEIFVQMWRPVREGWGVGGGASRAQSGPQCNKRGRRDTQNAEKLARPPPSPPAPPLPDASDPLWSLVYSMFSQWNEWKRQIVREASTGGRARRLFRTLY